MGLDTTHGAWHGAYSSFMSWRIKIAQVAGFPPLELMEGFYSKDESLLSINPFTLLKHDYPKGDELSMAALRRIMTRLPIKWDLFTSHPLYILLSHSDCDGDINYGACKKIADELEKLLPILKEEPEVGGHIGNYYDKTKTFIDGCRLAYSKKEKLQFQ